VLSDNYHKDYKIYGLLAIIIVIVIIVTILFSGNKLTEAYIDDNFLVKHGWSEDINDRFYEERLFGLEKQASFNYRIDGDYPSFLTVTSIKTLFMMSEEELLKKTTETIKSESNNLNLILDDNSTISGQRLLDNTHNSLYIIYNGTDNSISPPEKIKIIGETWNCAVSGTSIICIGFSQVSNNSETSLVNWANIIKNIKGNFVKIYNSSDFLGTDGLISNVKCH